MKNIKVLDCTLRDGGYCNNWRFGEHNIVKVMDGLSLAGIDVIECGFLTSNTVHDDDITKFSSTKEMKKFFQRDHFNGMSV